VPRSILRATIRYYSQPFIKNSSRALDQNIEMVSIPPKTGILRTDCWFTDSAPKICCYSWHRPWSKDQANREERAICQLPIPFQVPMPRGPLAMSHIVRSASSAATLSADRTNSSIDSAAGSKLYKSLLDNYCRSNP
jgi:hypothetical protein